MVLGNFRTFFFFQMSQKTGGPLLFTSEPRGPGRPVALHQTPPPPGQVTFQSAPLLQPLAQTRGTTPLRTVSASPSLQDNNMRLEQIKTVHAKNDYVDSPSTDSQKRLLPRQQDSEKSSNNNNVSAIVTQPLQKKPEEENDSSFPTSIYCSNCRKCKCDACRKPRELPRLWICNQKQEVSLQCAVDTCTCLCLVKCCFSSCFNYLDREEETVMASDNPCGCCGQPHCCKRWACMAGAAIACPTLLLYPLCKLGLLACTGCYNCCTHRGCTCRQDSAAGKQLLDSDLSST